jgi:hypothetical protein
MAIWKFTKKAAPFLKCRALVFVVAYLGFGITP